MPPHPEKLKAAAGLRARGRSLSQTATIMGVSRRTITAWQHEQPFKDEYARVQELSAKNDPETTLIDALGAHRGDGVDWSARLKAATELRNKPVHEEAGHRGGTVIVEMKMDAVQHRMIEELRRENQRLRVEISQLQLELELAPPRPDPQP